MEFGGLCSVHSGLLIRGWVYPDGGPWTEYFFQWRINSRGRGQLGGRHWLVEEVESMEFTPISCLRVILLVVLTGDREPREGFMDSHPVEEFYCSES
ncbi:hypothetical protein HOY80DRAFT_888942 [Tuber brumale]|nr:hypothetical protein HOY80DRAFT_888942 [Tuber brumale]